MSNTITFTIDGVDIQGQAGQTILEAADRVIAGHSEQLLQPGIQPGFAHGSGSLASPGFIMPRKPEDLATCSSSIA